MKQTMGAKIIYVFNILFEQNSIHQCYGNVYNITLIGHWHCFMHLWSSWKHATLVMYNEDII